ncbi:hypothetical protein MAR_023541 [Mya arenaria]|uniref:Mitochondria-eating protein C-terminal domain-containing protein n=1 Tax=Mya arenaria TaxID=6604 RepID=A0ABY7DPY0_MYAAR|nr:hypothetical protein MAR_023541 [Mya arenaria]
MREDQSILNRDEESHRTNTKRAWTFVEVLGLLCPILLFWRIWTFCQNSRKGCRYKRPGQEYEPVNDDLDTQTKLQEANKRLNTQTDENAVLQNRIDELQSENREMKHALEERDNKIVKLEQEKEILEKEKEDALNRLVEEKDNEIGKLQNEKAILEKEKEDALNSWPRYSESYTFCNEKAESSWSYVTQWFLPKGAHNAQTVRKSLKEGQKLQAPTLVSQLGEEFCDHIKTKCSVEQLRSVLDNKELAEYVHLCVKVCFLMAVNDPPVIIECPNRGKPDIKFNREEFKEYTTRGPFLAFYVWPLIRLHAGGPLLSKGVAQGANDPATRVAWTWST